MDSGDWYSKGEYHHAAKYGNDGQGIVGVEGLVSPAGSLYFEGLGSYWIGMCNLEVISHKGGIYCTYTMGHHEEIPDRMGQSIWIWIFENW